MNKKKSKMIYSDAHIESDDTLKSFALFIQTSRELLKYIDTRFRKEAGISMIQFMTLMILEQKLGEISPSELAKLTQTKRHNITTLMKRMEKDGYIKVVRIRLNGRNKRILITEKGKETLAISYIVADKMVNEVMYSFPKDDLSSFNSQLYLIMNNTSEGLKALTKDTEDKSRIPKSQ